MFLSKERLKIVAQGDSDKAKANARGKLFEELMTEVLRQLGYDIDKHHSSVNYSGMEIDIEGKQKIACFPLYAECKCFSTDVDCDKIQNFFGKYMAKWLKDERSVGLFIALPGINTHAKGFYNDNCENENNITVKLLQEREVLNALIESKFVVSGDTIEQQVDFSYGKPGDRLLICSNKGNFWVQYIVPQGEGIANHIQFFDSMGKVISKIESIEFLFELVPELREFKVVTSDNIQIANIVDVVTEEIVEIRGSSSCFEYQFPSSAQYFVGRENATISISKYIDDVLKSRTSIRGLLFEANSGWGKSSLVLSTISKLIEQGHYAVAIDSRSASSSQFILKTTSYIINKFGNFDGALCDKPTITGFDGAISTLINIGEVLKRGNKVLVIFIDQFENIFSLNDIFQHIVQLFLKITDAQTNIILGFSWKTDSVGLTREFPYKLRDIIHDASKVLILKQFSEIETNAMLDKLSDELHRNIRADLRFMLSDYSQGYPWLLKKLCAHVKTQILAGVAQAEMARGLLNVEQLFENDLNGLTPEQQATLTNISKLAPVSISDLGEEYDANLLQSFVDRRLLVRVGSKYDIYWDIFRDYLITKKVPIEEVYLLRAQVGSVIKAIKYMQSNNGTMDIKRFKNQGSMSDGTFLNIARDLRLLQIAHIENENIILSVQLGNTEAEFDQKLQHYLHEKLPKNRCVHKVLKELSNKKEITIDDLSELLKEEFPYISASKQTWSTYARILSMWLDLSDLVIKDNEYAKVIEYKASSQIRVRTLSFSSKRTQTPKIPIIHFGPIEKVAERIVQATTSHENKSKSIDWTGLSRSSIYKSLSMLEDMGLIQKKSRTIFVLDELYLFATDNNNRIEIARRESKKWPIFCEFINILNENQYSQMTHKSLGLEISRRCGLGWKTETARTNVKIMIDWARKLKLAQGVYMHSFRGKFKAQENEFQLNLFQNE